MNRGEHYEAWIHLAIRHEYYGDGTCPVTLVPSLKTKFFLDKAGVLFRTTGKNKWVLAKRTGELANRQWELLQGELDLLFELCPTSDRFYYLSRVEESAKEPYFQFKDSSHAGVWKTVEIAPDWAASKTGAEVNIKIATERKFWEYILIPKYNTSSLQLKLEEYRDKIQFEEVEKLELLDEPEVFRFRSTEAIKLNQIYDYTVKLSEIRANGERIISDRIPIPQPEQVSVISPRDTLTTYFYF